MLLMILIKYKICIALLVITAFILYCIYFELLRNINLCSIYAHTLNNGKIYFKQKFCPTKIISAYII